MWKARSMTDQTINAGTLDLREQIVRIDQMLAEHDRNRAQTEQLFADRDRKRQEIRWAPWQVAFTGMTAGAALFAAGAAAGGLFVKLLAG
jgi:hypothetical protein